ncbi:MAG: glycosyltransferase [Planctomycetota bacterium]|nr:MAG: glycosyltransferase [Planctomycetota bacterium]
MPTRNRPKRLAQTLDRLGRLTVGEPCEVVVVDNASDEPARVPGVLANGTVCRVIRLDHNAGAAARNVAVEASSPETDWIVMLDDDSHPVESVEPFAATVDRLRERPDSVAAVMADIHLPALGRRESGGLPEVFIGCGVAIRREAFVAAGGYDASFGYYVEEYDLAARFLQRGWSVAFDPAFCVHHHKIEAGRDMDLILHRLIRNNGWVMQRYAPEAFRRPMLREQRRRYRDIAEPRARDRGIHVGVDRAAPHPPVAAPRADARAGVGSIHRPCARARALARAWAERPFASAAIVEPGKNAWAVAGAMAELTERRGVVLTTADSAEVVVVGTMSPGPMLDAAERWGQQGRRVVCPWGVARVSVQGQTLAA